MASACLFSLPLCLSPAHSLPSIIFSVLDTLFTALEAFVYTFLCLESCPSILLMTESSSSSPPVLKRSFLITPTASIVKRSCQWWPYWSNYRNTTLRILNSVRFWKGFRDYLNLILKHKAQSLS